MKNIKAHSLPLYFVLAIGISWLSAFAAANFDLPLSTERAITVGPLMYVAMLTGPFLASFLMTSMLDGKSGRKDLWKRLTQWKVEYKWYLKALFLIPLVSFIVLLLLSLYSSDFIPSLITTENKIGLIIQGVFTGLFVGLFEEIGWSGFAVPKMRERFSIIKTGVIVGLVWGLWHFIPFWESNTFGDGFAFVLLLVRLFSWLVPFRIILTYVYDKTQSILLPVLMHASAVFSTLTLPSMELSGEKLIIWILSWTLALWGLVGFLNWKYLKR